VSGKMSGMRNSLGLEGRNEALDFIKSISILLVLFLHLKPIWFDIQPSSTFSITAFFQYIILFIRKYICVLAVPLFYIVSLYLLNLKSQASGIYIRKRVVRLSHLFLFWMIVQTVVFLILHGLNKILFNKPFPVIFQSAIDLIVLINKGGPDLPMVGDSVFYFIFNLIILVIISYLFEQLKSSKLKHYVSIIIITASVLYFEYQQVYMKEIVPYWNLTNFIVYVPMAWLLAKTSEKHFKLIIILSVVFVLFEFTKKYLLGLPMGRAYARGFVLFGTFAMFIFLYKMHMRGNLFKTLSIYSLGIFAIHKYWQLYFLIILNMMEIKSITIAGGFRVDLAITSLMCVLLTLGSIYFMNRTPFKFYVS
jgi:hypothetical protein